MQSPGFPPRPVRLVTMNVHITNAGADRNVSIRRAYLLLKAKPVLPFYEHLFTTPFWLVERNRPADVLKLPLNLAPQASEGGELVFELLDYLEIDPQAGPGRIEIHDAISGKMASFPAAIGVYTRHQGLRPTTYEERVTGLKAPQRWLGILGIGPLWPVFVLYWRAGSVRRLDDSHADESGDDGASGHGQDSGTDTQSAHFIAGWFLG
jgi:hypothetical protein